MAIYAKDTRPEFTPAPEGLHQAVCVDVIDLGLQKSTYEGKTSERHMVRLVWQIEEEDENGRRFTPSQSYTNSLNEKAKLRQHLEAWRGRKFTDKELDDPGFDLEVLIGVNCQIQVVHNIGSSKRTYANVQAVVPLGKGMTKMRPEGYVRVKDREELKKDVFAPHEDAEETEEPGHYGKPDYDDTVPF